MRILSRVCAGALVISVSCRAMCDMCAVSCSCMETVLHCKLQGGFLRAGHHVGKIWPLLPAIPPVLEQPISVGLWVLVNIIGRWCVMPAVLVRTLKATSQTKLKDWKPCQLLFNHKQKCYKWIRGGRRRAISSSADKKEHNNKKCYIFILEEAQLYPLKHIKTHI